jgi:GAF domain-containing protein
MDAQKLSTTFVELADSLVDDFDVFDVLHVLVEGCVDVLGVSAAGLLLADEQNRLHVAASSAERARLLDLYQLQNDEGPCLECYQSGHPVAVEALVSEQGRWPQFAAAAVDEGFASVLALPLRLRGRVIGALNLFGDGDGTLDSPDLIPVAQAMADVCTITILQERLGREQQLLNEQLQHALNSRVTIEQAKGALAAQLDIDPGEAFELLHKRARDTRRPLGELAAEVVSSTPPDKDFQPLGQE